VPADEPSEPTQVVDLAEALRNSLRRKGGGGKKKDDDNNNDLAGMSKADLVKLARELDISGRSTMSVAELRRAIKRGRERPHRKAS
jgi:DNA end-binding protein Ku